MANPPPKSQLRAQRRAAREAKRRNQRLMIGGAVALVVLVVAAILLSSQLGGNSSAPATDDGELVTTQSGLQYQILQTGDGAVAQPGNLVTVHYSGTLADGSVFDSSRDGAPFQFQLGQGEVIAGWDEGVAGMQVGEVRRLIIPPDLAYGAQGYPPVIPQNATLTFEVELLGVE